MRKISINCALIWLGCVVAAGAAPPVELEIATERGVQITAPQEWLQLLATIGIEHVQIHGQQSGDAPSVENRGTAGRPSFHVVGVLTGRDQLRLPGGTFGRGDKAKIKDYFAKLAADGAESMTAPKGRFGLTESELKSVLADLSTAIDFDTKGQATRAVLDRFMAKRKFRLDVSAAAEQRLREAAAFPDELKGVSAGTGLAIWLRDYGLVMQPEKPRGKAAVYRIVVADGDTLGQSTLGKTGTADSKWWPIGWDSDVAPGALAPSLMETLNAEIDGYSMEEAIAAVVPRIKVPLFIDHASLAAHKIEPAKIQVKVAQSQMSYKRLIDRVLSQGRLGSSIRVDENGKPFVWVTR